MIWHWLNRHAKRPAVLAALRRIARRRDPAARERALIAGSGLFDESYYLIQAPDVHEAGADAIDHFCGHGWREGRRPNACFDPAWYRELYLADAPEANPLLHYIRKGEPAGCRPIAFFDPAWYRRAYGLKSSQLALRHYLESRRSQRVAPNAEFDLDFYLARHRDEIGRNRDPFAHLIRCGAARDLDPSPRFDSRAYRAASMGAPPPGPQTLAIHERRVPLVHYLDAQARATARR